MNTGRVAFAHKLASAALLLLVLGVVFLLAWEWSRFKTQATPTTRGAQTTVLARSNSAAAPVSNAPAATVSEVARPTEQPITHPPQNVGAPEPPVSARAPKTRKPSPVSRAQNEQTVKLADGRELTFGGLTFGVEHSYANQKTHTNAQAAALLSASEQRDGGMSRISIKTPAPSLVVWLHCRAAKGSLLEADFISVVDEAGVEGELSNPSSIFNPAEFETVGAWQISNFPKRDAKIGIRFYSRDSSYKFHPLAEFWATNPAPRKYQVWSGATAADQKCRQHRLSILESAAGSAAACRR